MKRIQLTIPIAILLLFSFALAQDAQMHVETINGTETYDLSEVISITFSGGAVQDSSFELGNTGVFVDMVWIPAGMFQMGSPDTELGRVPDEGPIHSVTISNGFWFGKYEVTQAQWEAVTESNPSYYNGSDYPVEQVSHNNINNDFLPVINGTESGNPWRLPTEAEWEYACRAGTTTRFYWGDDTDYVEIGAYAWYDNNSSESTHPVGQKLPNAWGLYDMSGNVFEWCQDWYGSYEDGPVIDPTGPVTGSGRVHRGEAWSGHDWGCRSANRDNHEPSFIGRSVGFRLFRSGE